MYRRSRSGARRARRAPVARRSQSLRRKPRFERLEERHLLATFTVLNLDDAGPGSLRQAIDSANNSNGLDIIRFQADLTGTITLTTGEIAITQLISIEGPGAEVITVNGNANSRIFNFTGTSGDWSISGLTLTNGKTTGNADAEFNTAGGAVRSRSTGKLTIDFSAITDSHTEGNGADGGGVFAFGDLTITNSTISGNLTQGNDADGGGVAAEDLVIINSTISNNRTLGDDADGGGAFSSANQNITSSTIVDNSVDDGSSEGGGLWSGVNTFIINSIVALNESDGTNPDLRLGTNSANITFSLIGNNRDTTLVEAQTVDSNGNFIGSNGTPINPMIGPLADNGGQTQTHALLPASKAINAGDPTSEAGVSNTFFFDQRGTPFFRIANTVMGAFPRIDMGAFEVPLAPDIKEPNNTIATATALGSPVFVTLEDLSIHTPSDVDFFKYTAHSTGKLVVRILFDHSNGDLDLQIQDASGDIIATASSSSDTQDFEELVIPVVGQQMYFIRVFGAVSDEGGEIPVNTDDVNFYDMEVENFPAPIPTGIDLDAASDTGMMNNDNITSDNTPTFFLQADVLNFVDENHNNTSDPTEITVLTAAQAAAGVTPGIAIEVRLVNTSVPAQAPILAFAQPLSTMFPTVYSLTVTTALPDGVYFITAASRIFDGQTPIRNGRGSESGPLWVTIETDVPAAGTFDLIESSDTGMFNDDNVTNKDAPAFSGVGPANAKVHVFARGSNANGLPVGPVRLVGSGVVGTDATDGVPNDGTGLWEVTVEPMADGKWNYFARFEDASGNLGGPVAISATKTNDTAVPIPDPGTITSTVAFAAADFPLVGNVPMNFVPIIDVNVTVNITHPRDQDLSITLIAPDNTEIDLSSNNGGTGANYTNTVFDDSAVTSITAGTAPFTGSFRPEQALSALNDKNAIGTWTLRVTDNDGNEQEGTLVNWSIVIVTPLMVVIDTEAPNTPFLDLLDDTGRHNADNITKDNTPSVSMTTTDPNVAFSQLLWTDNFKFRIFDRFQQSAQEVLIYDSAQDAVADAFMFVGDMLTARTQLTRTLPVLTPVSPAITAGALSDGVHNLKLEVEDRAGNISHDFFLQITVDTTTPKVSFGQPDATSQIDGLHNSSDTGVITAPNTFSDRITSDTTPRMWGRAEANSVVKVYFDRNANGVIDLLTDTFLGQTVALPYDGNDGFVDDQGNPLGSWEIQAVLDLNDIAGVPKDGLRRLLVTAEDVAGNPMPMNNAIADGVDELQIFIDTQGPQITDVTVNNLTSIQYDLFDPKPTQTGFSPLVSSLKIAFRDLPARVDQAGLNINDFLYAALKQEIALAAGNYLLVGDHVGTIPIQSIQITNPGPTQVSGTLSAVGSTSDITAIGLVGAAVQPEAGDYILINNGPAAGQVRRITNFNFGTGQMTLDTPLLNLPVAGNTFVITKIATAVVTLNFTKPLPDDRYTLTVRDNLVDPAGNKLDGESNAVEPQEDPFFPTGDGVPGGNFVARFTIDSRPEIGTYVSQDIDIDINGNFIWDPGVGPLSSDATNVDLTFTLQVANNGVGGFGVHDLLFVGKFVAPNGPVLSRPFDQLAAFGNSPQLGFRWLVDRNSNGVIEPGIDILQQQPSVSGISISGAIPIAGNFDNNAANGDEIGLYNAGRWAFDTNRNFVIDAGDTFLNGNLLGHPIVGDFDGNGFDDLAVFNNNQFFFDLNRNGTSDQPVLNWGFPGVLDRPIAADMDQDGIDDLGLWVPRTSASLPQGIGEWYFLLSNDFAGVGVPAAHVAGNIDKLRHAFSPVPLGNDIFAEFGDERSLPIVGNFDPPIVAAPVATLVGDYDRNGRVEQADALVWRATFGSTTNLTADGNRNGVIDAGDYAIWRNNLGATAVAASASSASSSAIAVATTPQTGAGSSVTTTPPAATENVSPATSIVEQTTVVPVASNARLDAAAVDRFFTRLEQRPAARRSFLAGSLAVPVGADRDLLLVTLAQNADAPLSDLGDMLAVPHDSVDSVDSIVDDALAELIAVGDDGDSSESM